MQTANWNQGTTITPDELPAAITDYLAAHRARAFDAAITHYTDDAVVTDEGTTTTAQPRSAGCPAPQANTRTRSSSPPRRERTTSISTRSTTWKVISPAAWSTCISGSPCAAI
jgi:hypothetical protein